MSVVFLHYSGLAPDAHTDYPNRRGGPVPVWPGEWVRADSNDPWVPQHVQMGLCQLRDEIPDGIDYLDEDTIPGERWNVHWTAHPDRDPRKRARWERTAVVREILDLTEEEIEARARTLLPRPGGFPGLRYVDARLDRRRGRLVHCLPPPYDSNFVSLHLLATLKYRRQRKAWAVGARDQRARRRAWVDAMWDSGQYESKASLDKLAAKRKELQYPPKPPTVGETLHVWGVIPDASQPPSEDTLHRYRSGQWDRENLEWFILNLKT